MDKRSAMFLSGGLVLALVAGTVSREATLKGVQSAAPVRIVVQTPSSSSASATATSFDEESLR
jgi:hypothetical protein